MSKVMPIKILHLADTHLGMENYGRLDAASGLHTRLQDFARSLAYAVEYGIREGVDVCLFAGDAYRNCNPSPTHQREFAAQINKLARAGIPVVMVVGNHDTPLAFGKASALEIFATLDGERIRVVSRPQVFKLPTGGGVLQIVALPWPSRSRLLTKDKYKNLAPEQIREEIERIYSEFIETAAAGLEPDLPSVLLGHLNEASATLCGSNSERMAIIGTDPSFTTGTLARPQFNYVALGHIHKFQDTNENGAPPVVYPGSIDRIDFGEAGEEKGFCLVQVYNDAGGRRRADYEFVATPARPFVSIEVELDAGDPTAQLLGALEKYCVKDAIVRVSYTIAEEKQSLLDLSLVRQHLSEAFLVSGISRKLVIAPHQPRVRLSESLTMRQSLERYLDNQPQWRGLRDELLARARALEQELEAGD